MINSNVIEIEEILERAVQGRTNPFLCRGVDGNLYYVKGRHVGRRGQIAEWLGSQLALAFGLPAAPCVIVEISVELLAIAPPEWRELGTGTAFGSLVARNVLEMSVSNLHDVPTSLQRDVLLFDWWIMNGDRTLTAHGGNPNLLWGTENQNLVVIDHNLAFDKEFSAKDFFSCHIFRDQWNFIADDWIVRSEYEERLQGCYRCFDQIWDKMPDEWCLIGDGLPSIFNKDMAVSVLDSCISGRLWEISR